MGAGVTLSQVQALDRENATLRQRSFPEIRPRGIMLTLRQCGQRVVCLSR